MTQKEKVTASAKPINFTLYFKEEKDVYIQNVSPGQVSLQFGRGDDAQGYTLRRKRDPINLTNYIPFKKIAESTDFRRMLARKPALFNLLTEEQYQSYFQAKAKVDKVSVDEAIANAEAVANHKVVAPVKTTAPADEEENTASKVEREEDVVNPRVIHLCHQATSGEIPVSERMKPAELLQELKDLESEFKFDDLEYVLAHIQVKAIRSWATGLQKSLTAAKAS